MSQVSLPTLSGNFPTGGSLSFSKNENTIYSFNEKQLCHKCFALCRQGETQSKEYALFSIPCKSWQCPVCSKKKSYRYGKIVEEHFKAKDTRFATLTLAEVNNPKSAIRLMNKAWNKLRLAIQREWGKISYVRVLEFGEQNGRPHFHVLLDKYIPQKWLSNTAYRCGFGKVVDIRMAKNKQIVRYITKYLTKSLNSEQQSEHDLKFRFRRVVCSNDIKLGNFRPSDFKCISLIKKPFYKTPQELKEFSDKLFQTLKPERVERVGVNVFLHFLSLERVFPKERIIYKREIDYSNTNMYYTLKQATGVSPQFSKLYSSSPVARFNSRELDILSVLHGEHLRSEAEKKAHINAPKYDFTNPLVIMPKMSVNFPKYGYKLRI